MISEMKKSNAKFQGAALITGASSGFGLEFAKLFAADGYDLLVTARPGSKLAKIATDLAGQYGVRVEFTELDLAEPASAAQLHAWTTKLGWKVSYLINNAGVGIYGKFASNAWSRELELIELNVRALAELCHLYLPDMAGYGGGRVLNVSSIAAFQPGAYYSTYFASKAFVLLFSEALALESAEDNITVTTLCPGVSRTNFFDRAQMKRSSLILRTYLMNPKDVASAGYRGLHRGAGLVTPGLRNQVVSKSYRWLPRQAIAKITRELVKNAARG